MRSADASPPRSVDVVEILTSGTLEITGRLTQASNVTLLGTVSASGHDIACVYKPVRGERPLWDFPSATLAHREYAAYLVSEAAGWHCVPVTVLRDGPFGPGMVQQWISDADPDLVSDLLPADEVPEGWIPVLAAEDEHGQPVVLAHAAVDALQVLAGFDLVVNNADRKGSHILATPDGRVRGVDHGLTFHHEAKLRTILWGWAGAPLPDSVTGGLHVVADGLSGSLGQPSGLALGQQLAELLSASELDALGARVAELLRRPTFPLPPEDRTPIPWPPL